MFNHETYYTENPSWLPGGLTQRNDESERRCRIGSFRVRIMTGDLYSQLWGLEQYTIAAGSWPYTDYHVPENLRALLIIFVLVSSALRWGGPPALEESSLNG